MRHLLLEIDAPFYCALPSNNASKSSQSSVRSPQELVGATAKFGTSWPDILIFEARPEVQFPCTDAPVCALVHNQPSNAGTVAAQGEGCSLILLLHTQRSRTLRQSEHSNSIQIL
jgi:hypothetical protein